MTDGLEVGVLQGRLVDLDGANAVLSEREQTRHKGGGIVDSGMKV